MADATDNPQTSKKPLLTDINTLRERARAHLRDGAVTQGYRGDREKVISLLNEALATEIVCNLRYRYHYYMASGINAKSIAAEFLEHANEEQAHSDLLAKRITQLGGKPNFNPEGLTTRSHAEYVEGDSLVEMIEENLVAERIAIDSYREAVQYIGDDDPTSRRVLEDILAQEEEHAEDLGTMLEDLGRKGEPSEVALKAAKKR